MSGPPVLCSCGHWAMDHGFGCDVVGCSCPAPWWDLEERGRPPAVPAKSEGQLEFDEEAA